MSEIAASITIDVRPIPKPQRHPLIFDALEHLLLGHSLVVQNDHNPIPLRGQIAAIFGQQFSWQYLEEGPQLFQLQFTRRELAPDGWRRPEPKRSELTLVQPAIQPTIASPISVDLVEAVSAAAHSGPQWAHESEDLDVTLLLWENGRRIEPHVNSEVDVVWIGVAGEGVATIDGARHELSPGKLLLIPKGCERSVESLSHLSYLSLHLRRGGLMPTLNCKPLGG